MTKKEYEELTELGYLLAEKRATTKQKERFYRLWKRMSLVGKPDDLQGETQSVIDSISCQRAFAPAQPRVRLPV